MNENLTNNLVCSNCGFFNNSNSKFCVKCGSKLSSPIVDSNQSTLNQATNNQPINTFKDVTPNVGNESFKNPVINNTMEVENINYLSHIFGSILKPFDKFKENENALNVKNSLILSVIVVVIATVINLLTTILTTVRVKSLWSNEVSWVWDNLGKINYFKIIGQNILICGCILLAIAGVYFLASLVIKKDVKFNKLLGATVTSVIPAMLVSPLLSQILSMIYVPLGICITVIGVIYTLITLLELMNELIKIENKNVKIYFHVICLSVLIIGGGFVAYKLILTSITSNLGSLGNLLT